MKYPAFSQLLVLAACAPSMDPAAKASPDSWRAGIRPCGTSYSDQEVN